MTIWAQKPEIVEQVIQPVTVNVVYFESDRPTRPLVCQPTSNAHLDYPGLKHGPPKLRHLWASASWREHHQNVLAGLPIFSSETLPVTLP